MPYPSLSLSHPTSHLFHSRLPRYDAIAKLGYTVTSGEVDRVENENDFMQLLETAIARQQGDDD